MSGRERRTRGLGLGTPHPDPRRLPLVPSACFCLPGPKAQGRTPCQLGPRAAWSSSLPAYSCPGPSLVLSMTPVCSVLPSKEQAAACLPPCL